MSGPEALVTVEPVESRKQLRRFAEIPFVLHGHEPRWTPDVRAYEQWLLDSRRHPYFERGDAAFLLARQAGAPIGRIAAHVDGSGGPQGWFGMFDVPDDLDVTRALVDAAQAWLAEQGATSMTGPITWTADEHFGVLVEGFDRAGATARPWRPRWYAEHLRELGARPGERRATYDLPTAMAGWDAPPPADEPTPPQAGAYADPELVLDGIAAVPDVSRMLAGASIREAWRLARTARDREFETAVCVRCDGDPAALVPRLLAACRINGYTTLLSPWAPDARPPDRVHQVFTLG